MAYTEVRKILKGELTGEPFNMSGKFQILVTHPLLGRVLGPGTIKVELQFRSPHPLPAEADRWIPWKAIEQEGIIEGEAIQGVLYRVQSVDVPSLGVAVSNLHASVWLIRNWISSRPGR